MSKWICFITEQISAMGDTFNRAGKGRIWNGHQCFIPWVSLENSSQIICIENIRWVIYRQPRTGSKINSFSVKSIVRWHIVLNLFIVIILFQLLHMEGCHPRLPWSSWGVEVVFKNLVQGTSVEQISSESGVSASPFIFVVCLGIRTSNFLITLSNLCATVNNFL